MDIKKAPKWGFRVQIRVQVVQILDFQGLLRRERIMNLSPQNPYESTF